MSTGGSAGSYACTEDGIARTSDITALHNNTVANALFEDFHSKKKGWHAGLVSSKVCIHTASLNEV